MDREDLIDMAVDAGARDFGNPDMWGVLQMSYESIERFAKEVAAQERRKCEDEAITKNIVANWHCPDCERNRYRAALWRAEAYKQAGHDVIERPWVGLTEREVELIDGMIEVELKHAERCDRIANRNMAEKQKGWDMERVALLRKIKEQEHMTNKELMKQIGVRIMLEAYDLADRDDAEGYNSVKVMCSDVLAMIAAQREWVGLDDNEFDSINPKLSLFQFYKAIESKLRSKNT